MKFGRTYQLQVQAANPLLMPKAPGLNLLPFFANPGSHTEFLIINYPLTLEFEVTRNTFASANTGRFTIYNLGENTRRQIYHDRYDMLNYRQIILQAGYQSQQNTPLATIFQGNVRSAYSYKHKENWTTVIDAWDGGFGIVNGQISASVGGTSQPWTIQNVIQTLISAMPNVSPGTVNLPAVQNYRPVSLFGNAWNYIRSIIGNNTAFIDNEKVNVVTQGTFITATGGIQLIDSDTGLLGTPRRLGSLLEVDMIFEPRIQVNQIVQLQSEETYYNGKYAVMGFTHKGTISGAICGDAITTLSLWSGTQALEPAQQEAAVA